MKSSKQVAQRFAATLGIDTADALSRLLSPKSPAKARGKLVDLHGKAYLVLRLSDGNRPLQFR